MVPTVQLEQYTFPHPTLTKYNRGYPPPIPHTVRTVLKQFDRM